MQHDVETNERAILEGIRWCHDQGATVRWRAGTPPERSHPACVVEVVAPGTTWNLLRGCGSGFYEAYTEARDKHEAWARETPRRCRHPGPDGRRWSA